MAQMGEVKVRFTADTTQIKRVLARLSPRTWTLLICDGTICGHVVEAEHDDFNGRCPVCGEECERVKVVESV